MTYYQVCLQYRRTEYYCHRLHPREYRVEAEVEAEKEGVVEGVAYSQGSSSIPIQMLRSELIILS